MLEMFSAKNQEDALFSNKTVCHGAQLDVTRWRKTGIFKMPYFRNEGHYRCKDLSGDTSLGVLSHGGDKKLAGFANVDFRILRCHMKTSNKRKSYYCLFVLFFGCETSSP